MKTRKLPLTRTVTGSRHVLITVTAVTVILIRHSAMGTTLRAAPSKNYAFSTNYYACIAMPTWHRCAPPILCWRWYPYNLLLRLCLTRIDLHKFLLRSHAATCPTSNCGCRTSLLQQELVCFLFLSPAAPKARDGRYCNAPRPSVCLSVHLSVSVSPSVTCSFRTVTQKRIDVFSWNFAGMYTMSWGCAV